MVIYVWFQWIKGYQVENRDGKFITTKTIFHVSRAIKLAGKPEFGMSKVKGVTRESYEVKT